MGLVARPHESYATKVGLITGIESLPLEMQRLLFDPQTSGGLLISLEQDDAAALVDRLRGDGYTAALVGEVCEGEGLRLEG